MATTKTKFEGWSFTFLDSTLSEGKPKGARRGKRGASGSSRLILKRDEDGFEVKSGDTIVVTDPSDHSRQVVLITEATIGIADYVTLTGLNFFRLDEVSKPPNGTHEQELFLTTVPTDIFVQNIVERAYVLNQKDFQKISIDDSNKDTVFICQKGYDTFYETYSSVFNIEDIKNGLLQNPEELIQTLRDVVLKPPYKPKKETVKASPRKTIKVEPSKRRAPSTKPKPNRQKKAAPDASHSPSKRRRISEVVIDISEDDGDADDDDGKRDSSDSEDSEQDDDINEDSDSDSDSDSDVVMIGKDDTPEDGSDGEEPNNGDNSGDESVSSDDAEQLFEDDDDFRPRGTPVKRGRGRPRKYPIKEAKTTRKYTKRTNVKGPKTLMLGNDSTNGSSSSSKELKCRSEQFQSLFQAVESAIEVENGVSIYIHGPPGAGKTATVREVVRQLYKRSKIDQLTSFEYLEINGMKVLTPDTPYELLWNKISGDSVAASNIQGELQSYFSNGKSAKPLVVLLDELDQLANKSQSLLYNFFDWPTFEKSKLIVIAVGNTMNLPERSLENKTASRLGLQRLEFPAYTHEQLVEIIKSKFDILITDNVQLKDDAVEFAARKIASVSGDARRALKICQRAVELAIREAEEAAEEDNEEISYPIVVKAVHINRAILETTNSPVAQFIKDLSFVGQLLLTGILSKKRKSGLAENSMGDVIDEISYIVKVNTAKVPESSKNDNEEDHTEKSMLEILYEDFVIRPRGFDFVLNELIESGLVLQQNKKSDRNSLVKLNIADEEITSTFKKEKDLKYFANLTSTDS